MRGCREGIERCGDTPQAVQSLKKHGKQLHALKSRRTPRCILESVAVQPILEGLYAQSRRHNSQHVVPHASQQLTAHRS